MKRLKESKKEVSKRAYTVLMGLMAGKSLRQAAREAGSERWKPHRPLLRQTGKRILPVDREIEMKFPFIVCILDPTERREEHARHGGAVTHISGIKTIIDPTSMEGEAK